MDLRTLKTFHLIVKYGSFIRAAEEMNYAQSTVTMQMQKLESDLGVPLIERGKKIRLTEAGRLFHEQSLQIVKNMEHLQTNLTDLQMGDAGSIRLGATDPTASHRLPRILQAFLSRFPKIKVSVDIASTPVLCERLLEGEIDLAVCSAPDLGSELAFEPLFKETFSVLMPDRHPLAEREEISPDDMRGHRLLITSASCPYRRKLETALQESGHLPADTMEISSMNALKYFVESGLGIALVPDILLQAVPPGTAVRTMSGVPIDMTIGMLYKRSDYPLKLASLKLYRFLKQELQSNPPYLEP